MLRRTTRIELPWLAGLLAALIAAGCGSQEIAPPVPYELGEETEVCEMDEAPERLFLRQGILAEAEWWQCRRPMEGSGAAEITSVEGNLAAVTGSTARVLLRWQIDQSLAAQGTQSLLGMHLIFWYGSSRSSGYYRIPIESEENPLPIDFYLNYDALGGDFPLNFAIDDGTGPPEAPVIGVVETADFELIQVGSGDIQVNLNWDTVADLDLYVTDPNGEEIFFGDMNSASGGQLDLDSYAACPFHGTEGRGNENIYWPVDGAPDGEYLIEVHVFSDCQTFAAGLDTHYRVTLILDRTDVWMYEGIVTEGGAVKNDPGLYEKVKITRFNYPQ